MAWHARIKHSSLSIHKSTIDVIAPPAVNYLYHTTPNPKERPVDTATFWIIALLILAVIILVGFALYTRRHRVKLTIPGTSLEYQGDNDPLAAPPTPATSSKSCPTCTTEGRSTPRRGTGTPKGA